VAEIRSSIGTVASMIALMFAVEAMFIYHRVTIAICFLCIWFINMKINKWVSTSQSESTSTLPPKS
jgi:hypothetical protein